ncbi:MAG TPA: hypothetical protein VJN94_07055 [Candidatus Binataceae bacterium]|nr:hypothetical protein [Candidatus Binataceae bacterium]
MDLKDFLRDFLQVIDKLRADISRVAAVPKQEKDFWDKFATLSTFLSSVLLAAIGLIFTTTYNAKQTRLLSQRAHEESMRNSTLKEQENRIAAITAVDKFMGYLSGDAKTREVAIVAINALGISNVATALAKLYPDSGGVAALNTIARSGNPADSKAATAALSAIYGLKCPLDKQTSSTAECTFLPKDSGAYTLSATARAIPFRGVGVLGPVSITVTTDDGVTVARCSSQPVKFSGSPGIVTTTCDNPLNAGTLYQITSAAPNSNANAYGLTIAIPIKVSGG